MTLSGRVDSTLLALALASAFCFALGLVLGRIGLRHLPPLRGAAVSVPTTALFFLLLSPIALPGSGFEPDGALIFLLVGLLYPAAVTLLNFAAVRRIGPEVTGALGNLTPLFAVLLAWPLLGEAPRAGQAVALLAIVVGMLLLFGLPRQRAGIAIWAFALPLAAALIRGLVQPVVKLGLSFWPSPFAATLCGYLASATALLVLAAMRPEREGVTATPRGRLWFACVGLANGLAVLFLYAALSRGAVALVAPLVACYPLLTLLLNRLLPGGARLPPLAMLGIAVTVAGVMLLLLAA